MMDTPFHYGILPMLDTAFQMFEQNSRGKCRTELVLQSMKHDDIILVYGRDASRDVEQRLRMAGKHACLIVEVRPEHILDPANLHAFLKRKVRPGSTVHVDHTVVTAWIEQGLVQLNHHFQGLVGMIGMANCEVAEIKSAAPPELYSRYDRNGPRR